jgi:hypothetical protein
MVRDFFDIHPLPIQMIVYFVVAVGLISCVQVSATDSHWRVHFVASVADHLSSVLSHGMSVLSPLEMVIIGFLDLSPLLRAFTVSILS